MKNNINIALLTRKIKQSSDYHKLYVILNIITSRSKSLSSRTRGAEAAEHLEAKLTPTPGNRFGNSPIDTTNWRQARSVLSLPGGKINWEWDVGSWELVEVVVEVEVDEEVEEAQEEDEEEVDEFEDVDIDGEFVGAGITDAGT